MIIAVVLATGPGMSQALADSVRGKCVVIAVNNAHELAPWADALVANDQKWWNHNRAALKFAGRKFCGARYPGTERLTRTHECGLGSCSGLQGMRVARDEFHAEKILLSGFDFRGTHYFGQYPKPLKNTSDNRREIHKRQLARFNRSKCEVINCTPGSALECFPIGDLAEQLA